MQISTIAFIAAIIFLLIAGINYYNEGLTLTNLYYALFGLLLIALSILSHVRHVETEKLAKEEERIVAKYESCVEDGYSVYLDGQEIDGSKIDFSTSDYKAKYTDNKEILLTRTH